MWKYKRVHFVFCNQINEWMLGGGLWKSNLLNKYNNSLRWKSDLDGIPKAFSKWSTVNHGKTCTLLIIHCLYNICYEEENDREKEKDTYKMSFIMTSFVHPWNHKFLVNKGSYVRWIKKTDPIFMTIGHEYFFTGHQIALSHEIHLARSTDQFGIEREFCIRNVGWTPQWWCKPFARFGCCIIFTNCADHCLSVPFSLKPDGRG